MFTNPIVRQPIMILDERKRDSSSINRILAAAAINPRYRANLLSNPEGAIHSGFCGEKFPFSESTYNALVSIQASSMPDFVNQLQDKLGNFVQTIS